jgi:hypothetical protein
MSTTVLLLRRTDNDLAGHTLVGWTPGIQIVPATFWSKISGSRRFVCRFVIFSASSS